MLPIKLVLLIAVPLLVAASAALLLPTILSVDDLKRCPQTPVAADRGCQPADAVVAISGGDTVARTREAIKLYQNGWASQLVLSGAALDKSGPSNAAAMRQQAISAGVPASAIVLDEYAVDTEQNAAGLRAIADQRQLRRIILVTSPYHQRRASIEFARALGVQTAIVNHPTPEDRYWSPQYWWINPYSWYLAVTEIVKLIYVSVTNR